MTGSFMKPVWAPYEEKVLNHNCFQIARAVLSGSHMKNGQGRS